jgi:ABC-type uncharacterized transport system auxiliary subunit
VYLNHNQHLLQRKICSFQKNLYFCAKFLNLKLKTMKKLLAIVSIAAFMTACGGNEEKTTTTGTDTTKMAPAADTTKMAPAMDTAKAAIDTAKKMMDTAKAKMDKAVDKMNDAKKEEKKK